MALAAQDPERAASSPLHVVVIPSAAVELYWATMVRGDGRFRVEHPLLERLAEAHPDLLGQVRDFWGRGVEDSPEACGAAWSFPEWLVLADRAGVLDSSSFSDALAAVAAEAARAGPPLRLASESERDRVLIRQRLVTLKTDRSVRRSWLAVLQDMAAALDGQWQAVGRAVSQRACRARASQMPWTDDLSVIRTWAQSDFGGILDRVLAQAATDGQPVLVVPSYWSGKGVLFDLPNHVMMGIPAQPGARESRSRTEPLVGGVRALADPTRLAIVDYLVGTPRTVGELALDFQLAQPTISRHVRILRDAGLLTEARQGNAVVLGADQDAIGALLDEIGAALTGGAGTRLRAA